MSRLIYGKRTGALTCAIALLLAAPAEATRYYVDAAATGNNDGSEWEHAFTDLQSALGVPAVSGDEIWVAVGTGPYIPSVKSCVSCGTPSLEEYRTFRIPNGVKIYGGFLGTQYPNFEEEDEDSIDDRDPERNVTILSGDLGSSTFAFHVVTAVQVLESTLLSGFTITGGHAGSLSESFGGGLYIYGGETTPSSLQVTRCKFVDNHALDGGGAAVYWQKLTTTVPARFVNCVFEDNAVDASQSNAVGGGAYVHYAVAQFVNCVFRGNTADAAEGYGARGAGLYVECDEQATPSDGEGCECVGTAVINCTFAQNDAKSEGGAIYGITCEEATSVAVRNSIVWANTPDQIEPSDPNTTVSVTYSDIQGSWSGTGNLDEDPQFCGDGVQLHWESPCVDAGKDSDLPLDVTDVNDNGDANETLPWDLIRFGRVLDMIAMTSDDVDMGAHENPRDPECPADIAGDDGIVGLDDLSQMITWYGHEACYGDDAYCLADFTCDNMVGLDDLAIFLSFYGTNCNLGFTPVEGQLAASISPWNTNGYSGGGFAGESQHFVFDALIEIDEEDDDWTVSGTVITAANGATFRLAPVDPNSDTPIPGSSEPDKYATFFSVPKSVNANGRFNNPMGDDGAIAGACHPIAPDYTFTTTSITACWYDKDGDSNDGPAAVLRLVLDVSGVSGADTSGGFGSVYFSTSGPTSGGDIKVADFGLATAHAAEGGELSTVMGRFT